MIGSGVFVTSGFLASDLDPAAILLSWLLGGLLAVAGALCYAAVAQRIPLSGGEYRYLHDLFHPLAGYVAGWVSLIFAFAGPMAMAALAAGAYAEVLTGRAIAMPVALVVLLGVGAVQAAGLKWGELVQNIGFVLKVGIILVFLGGAFFSGIGDPMRALPTSQTLSAILSLPFATAQIYVGFAFAGWSAAVYLASQVENPVRNVPRAMLLGLGAVTLMYLLLNFVFVTTLSPQELQLATQSEGGSITLGHLVALRLLGDIGGRLASAMIFLILVSCIIAMTMSGPWICDAMARDRFLPSWAKWTTGRMGGVGPVGLLVGVAVLMLLSNTFEAMLNGVGVTLAIFGALSASAILKIKDGGISKWRLAALAVYLLGVGWSVVGSLIANPLTILWVTLTLGVASLFYVVTVRRRAPEPVLEALVPAAPLPGAAAGQPEGPDAEG
jgi:APA family basic amino acid/polyamine antiporter